MENCSVVRWNKFFLELIDVLQMKEERDHPGCYQLTVQKPASLMVCGCISAYGVRSLYIWKDTIDAKEYIEVLEEHMLPYRRRLCQGRPCIFQQDNAKPHTASITTAWLYRRRVQVLNWSVCSPDLSPVKNIWCIIKGKIWKWRPRSGQYFTANLLHEMAKCFTFSISYVLYVLLGIKHGFMRFANHCFLLFMYISHGAPTFLELGLYWEDN